jgi:hypothetical protein
MVFRALGEAFGWLAKTPLIWLSGIAAAIVLFAGYFVYDAAGIMTASSVVLVLLFMFPAVLAGTYGLISENSVSFRVFRDYALKGYFRCLLPLLLTGMLAWVLSQFLAYLLMLTGTSYPAALQFSLFVYVPVLFFCFFADITAVVHNLRMFESLKDSALRVLNRPLSAAGYYLMNILLLFLASVFGSFIWAALAAEPLLRVLNVTEEQLLSYSQEELMAFSGALGTDVRAAAFSDSSLLFATVTAGALTAAVFLPLLVAYKACYFRKTSPFSVPELTPEMMNPEGEYDEKGRWYKYK